MGNAAPTTRRKHTPPAVELPVTLEGVETFAAGEYPGDGPGEVWTYTTEDVATIVRNFGLLSEGKNPLHRVPVVVTHDKAHAYAWVSGAARSGDLLTTDWADVEPSLARRIRARRLIKVSPEIKRDFTDRNGTVYPGPYLYRVSVLGADVPRVKGLADLPESFADRKPGRRLARPFKFADPSRAFTMNRDQATAFLQQMGMDPATFTGVPDAFLIAVAQAWSDEENQEGDGTGGNGGNNMDDAGGTAGNNGGTAGAGGTGGGVGARNPQPKKVSVTETYADPRSIRKLVAHEVAKGTAAALKTLNDAAAAEAAAREKRAAEERQAAVRLFCDRQAKDGKLTPAENDEGAPTSVRARLLRLAAQPQVVHKFADPKDPTKQVERTELEIQQEEITARQPRKFSERIHQGGGQGQGERDETGCSTEHAQRTKAYWERRRERSGAGSAGGAAR